MVDHDASQYAPREVLTQKHTVKADAAKNEIKKDNNWVRVKDPDLREKKLFYN